MKMGTSEKSAHRVPLPSSMSDISKLTVARLRALCKDKGLKNYSKLPKPALLEKLAASGSSTSYTDPTVNPKSFCDVNVKEKEKNAVVDSDTSFPRESLRIDGPVESDSIANTLEEPSDTPPQTREKPAKFISSRPLAEGYMEKLGFSMSSGSKRSVDIAFPHSLCQKPTKFPKIQSDRVDHVSASGATGGFKVPELPQKELEMSPTPLNAAICAGKPAAPYPTKRAVHSGSESNISKTRQVSVSHLGQSSTQGLVRPAILGPLQNNSGVRSQLQQNSQIRAGFSRVNDMQTEHSTTSLHPPSTPSISSSHHRCQTPARSRKPKFIPPRTTATVETLPGNIPSLSQMKNPAALLPSARQPLELTVLNSLKTITIPPSMTQRKLLPLISIALSGLEDRERAKCVLVSKLFRYAVYVSAQNILRHRFPGERLSRLISNLSSRGLSLSMTNLWPYLRLRMQEVIERKKEFKNSWVPRFLGNLCDEHSNPICNKLWTSPDHEEQFLVAFRFTQTRICFTLAHCSLGNIAVNWVTSTVINAQPILEDEIWSITVAHRAKGGTGHLPEETFYVLYQTCEVIGHPPPASVAPRCSNESLGIHGSVESGIPCTQLRADWSSYISFRYSTATRNTHASLAEHMLGTNTDDFERGVARVWLQRMEKQGEDGVKKMKVAEKYLLGCVLRNSVSGEYKSAAQMSFEFAGIPDAIETRTHRRDLSTKLNMVIPERHNVESVHFTKRGGLHPELAVVQTAGRQEGTLVLKDNGIVIGEDEKVPAVWRRLLGCNEAGVAGEDREIER